MAPPDGMAAPDKASLDKASRDKSENTAVAVRTADQVLDVAERLVQTRGFNGFSYADVSAEVGVTKATLHYHFPSKAELGRALVERYTRSFERVLAGIDAAGDGAVGRLERYAQVYRDVLAADRMCLCGMLAAEYSTLPPQMQRALHVFFDANEAWLRRVLEAGRDAGVLGFTGTPRDAARLLTAALEGAMLLARSYGDPSRLAIATRHLLGELVERGTKKVVARRTRPH
jgi:TetR/AcrR family transcriptional regulator, transcriptional repressor for nem operon